MKIIVERRAANEAEAEALIVPVFQGRRDARFGAGELFDSGEVAGKPLEMTLLHHAPGVRATRVLLAGAGKAGEIDAAGKGRLNGGAPRGPQVQNTKKPGP